MRIAVLSDIHSNHIALEQVIKDATQRGVDNYWFLGDVINYGWGPVETINLLRGLVKPENWVLGNHDALYLNLLHAGEFRVEAQIMMNHNRALIDQEKNRSQEFMDFMERYFFTDFRIPKQKYLDGIVYNLSHDAYDFEKFDEYYVVDTYLSTHKKKIEQLFFAVKKDKIRVRTWKFWKNLESMPRLLFYGHSHLPVVAFMDDAGKINSLKVRKGRIDLQKDCPGAIVTLVNPGSVGFPKDRWHYPSYVLLDTTSKQIEFCRIKDYPFREFDDGYRKVKKNIEEYIKDGLWKRSSSNGVESFERFEIGKLKAQEYLERIGQEIFDAPHPFWNELQPDWQQFYLSDLGLSLSKETNYGN